MSLKTGRDPSNRGILASYKTETTSDVASGIRAVIRKGLEAEGVHEAGPQLLSLTVVTIVRNQEFSRTSHSF